jgi:hypothetical protein
MNIVGRRLFALLSACGIAASAFAYIGSFFLAKIDSMNRLLIVSGAGLVLLVIPIFAIEPSLLTRKNFWNKFTRGMPSWASTCIIFFSLVVIAHIAWIFVQSGGGVPIIRDGHYLLNDHGRVLKALTETEYLTLKEDDVRLHAIMLVAGYSMPMFYWWFPRGDREAD